MRWKGRERSENVEDRRGATPGRVAGGGGLMMLVIVVIALFMGADPRALVDIVGQPPAQQRPAERQSNAGNDATTEFIEVVLHDTETVWTQLFRDHVQGAAYQPPRLIIFSGL